MADNTQLPNGFTGFAFRKPAGGTSAADAIREREAQRAAHAGQPAPAQTRMCSAAPVGKNYHKTAQES